MQKTALRARFSSEALTAMESSMGSSGGMTLVMIIVQFSSSLKRSRSGFCTSPSSSATPPRRALEAQELARPCLSIHALQRKRGTKFLLMAEQWKLHMGRASALCHRARSQLAGIRI